MNQLIEKYKTEIDKLKLLQNEYDLNCEDDLIAWHEDEMQINMYSSFIKDIESNKNCSCLELIKWMQDNMWTSNIMEPKLILDDFLNHYTKKAE